MQTWAMIVDSFREARDRKIFWVMLLLSIAVAGAMFCVGIKPDRIDVFFGAWVHETSFFGTGGALRKDLIAALVVDIILDTALGSVGMVLVVVATAGFFPATLDRSAIQVLASKPMPRWKLFLGRYVGAMTFMGFQATVFVTLTFLVMGFRWGTWLPAYLLTVPLMVVLFSYLFCVSALVAVMWRSTIASVLLTLGAWFFFTGVQSIGDMFEMYPTWQEHTRVYRFVKFARWVVPKTQDITYVAKRWTKAAPGDELMPDPDPSSREMVDRAKGVEARRLELSPLYTIGSSLVFELMIVLLAMWRFTRLDF